MILVTEALEGSIDEVIKEQDEKIIKQAIDRTTRLGARTEMETIYLLEKEVMQYREENRELRRKIEEKKRPGVEGVRVLLELETEAHGKNKIAFENVDVKEVCGKVVIKEHDGTLLFVTKLENVNSFDIVEI